MTPQWVLGGQGGRLARESVSGCRGPTIIYVHAVFGNFIGCELECY